MADLAVASTSSSSKRKQQRAVCISAEDQEEEDEESDEEEEETSGSEEETDEDDAASDEESAESSSDDGHGDYDDSDDGDDDDDDGDYDDDDDDDGDYDDDGDDDEGNDSKSKPTDEEHCNKVINLLRGRKSLNSLKLEECKAYLRKHEVRISGNKETCIKRILEHWRIKDGNGIRLYPKSSFVINCTGDVCRGDVVMFKQKVYEKFDIVKRGGGAKILGKRIIAGRVVSESYGDVKQQHTFSIEVLWSKGVKPLPPLSPLLVKGRNLYRLKTFRQPWSNEAERSRVLAEKHSRGAAARHIREIARTKGFKRKKKSSGTKAPPTKKKQNCAKKPSNDYSNTNTRTVAKTSNSESSATRSKAKTQWAEKMRNLAKASNSRSSAAHSQAKTQGTAKANNSRSSATHSHAKMREVAKTGTSKSSAHAERPIYHPNGIHSGYPYHQRYPYYNHNQTPTDEVLRRNNIGIPQANRGTYHMPSYNMGYTSSAAGVPHGHVLHSYNMSYPSSVRRQIPNSVCYGSHLYGNPAFQLDPGRRVVFDDRVSGGQFDGWRRP